jgi:uncharacterized protein YerC
MSNRHHHNVPAVKYFLTSTLHRLVKLYTAYKWKEDCILFPMTDKLLTPDEQQALLDKFEVEEMSAGLALP